MATELAAFAVGGALGALLRAGLIVAVAVFVARSRGGSLPGLRFGPALATVAANTFGCLLFGLWAADLLPAVRGVPIVVQESFVLGGVCGGLTTFSTLCADAVWLARARGGWASTSYLLTTLLLGAGAFHIWLITLLPR